MQAVFTSSAAHSVSKMLTFHQGMPNSIYVKGYMGANAAHYNPIDTISLGSQDEEVCMGLLPCAGVIYSTQNACMLLVAR